MDDELNNVEEPPDIACDGRSRERTRRRKKHKKQKRRDHRETTKSIDDAPIESTRLEDVAQSLRPMTTGGDVESQVGRKKRNKKRKKKRKRDDDNIDENTADNVVPEVDARSVVQVDDAEKKQRRKKRKRRAIVELHEADRISDNCETDHAADPPSSMEVAEETVERPTKKKKKRKMEGDDEKQKVLCTKCDVFTHKDRAATGPVWKIDDDDAIDDDDIAKFNSVSKEVEAMWPDSSCSETEEDGDSDLNDQEEDSNVDDDDLETEELDPNRPKLRKAKNVMPDVDFNDFVPATDDEMEQLLEMKIVIDWDLTPLHSKSVFAYSATSTADCGSNDDNANIRIRVGPLTFLERKSIIARWEEFKKLYGVSNPLYHLGTFKSKLQKSEKVKFLRFIGKGLDNRTLSTIYRMARKMFSPYNFAPLRKTKKEMKLICNLVKRFGNKWTKMEKILKRRNDLLRMAYLHFKGNYNKGSWSSMEYRRLIAALVALTGERDLRKLHHGLPWTKASQIVRTRGPHECRDAWIWVMSKQLFFDGGGRRWNDEDTIRLIEMLHDGQFESELDVPWAELYPHFDMTNCTQISSRWGTLRHRVPGYYLMPYHEQVEYLHRNVIPSIRARQKAKENREELKRKKQQASQNLACSLAK